VQAAEGHGQAREARACVERSAEQPRAVPGVAVELDRAGLGEAARSVTGGEEDPALQAIPDDRVEPIVAVEIAELKVAGSGRCRRCGAGGEAARAVAPERHERAVEIQHHRVEVSVAVEVAELQLDRAGARREGPGHALGVHEQEMLAVDSDELRLEVAVEVTGDDHEDGAF
jgi:hypothetical protein